ncbi:hypothetical protein B2A_02899, partial [mine drainage metagenome]
ERYGPTRLVSHRRGLPRGPHNCGRCDREVLAAIEAASLTQTFEGLETLACPCRTEWQAQRSLEPLGIEA